MEDNKIFGIIQQALEILEKEVGLAKSTLDVVASRSFKPISEFFKEKQEVYYSADLLNELEQRYQENLKTGAISRNVYTSALEVPEYCERCMRQAISSGKDQLAKVSPFYRKALSILSTVSPMQSVWRCEAAIRCT